MTDITGRSLKLDELYKKNDEFAQSYPRDLSKMNIPHKESLSYPKLQYYDSLVKNSHQYPNMIYCRPYDLENTPTNVGALVDKSIRDTKFVVGGTIYSPSPKKPLWF